MTPGSRAIRKFLPSIVAVSVCWSCSSDRGPSGPEVGSSYDVAVEDSGPPNVAPDTGGDVGPPATELVGGPIGAAVVADGPALGDTICVSTHVPTAREAAGERDADLDLLEELGAAHIRQDFYWHETEPTEGTFDFEAYDRLVDEAAGRQIGAIALLAYGNPWATTATDDDIHYPPDDPATFARWSAELANHFDGRVGKFEIWNEANSGLRFFKPEPDAAHYAEMVVAAADAIHDVRPDAEVAPGGLIFHGASILDTPDATDFLAEMANAPADVSRAIDGFAIHPYTLYPPRSAPEASEGGEVSLREQVAQQRDALGIDDSLALWVTEFGWPVWGTVDAGMQRDWLVRTLLISFAEGSSVSCIYTLRDEPDAVPEAEGLFGLVDADGERRPAFDAIASLSRVGDRSFARRLEIGQFPMVRGITLGKRGASEDTVVLWTVDDSSTSVILPVQETVSSWELFAVGADETTVVSSSGGRLAVNVGATPVVATAVEPSSQ